MADIVKAVERSGELVQRVLRDHEEEIRMVYLREGTGSLKVNLGIKLAPKGEDIEAEVSISFISDQVKDSVKAIVSSQADLFRAE